MREYKSVKTVSEMEVKTIELYETFGWRVEDSRESGNRLTLRFHRDTEMPHYEEIVSYEKEYFSVTEKKEVPKTFGTLGRMILLSIAGVIGLIVGIILFSMSVAVTAVGIILFVVAAVLWIPFIVSHKKASAALEYNKNINAEKLRRQSEILAECRALIG